MGKLSDVWNTFTAREKRNIAIYIAGIMMYKMGLEFVSSGSITTRFTATVRDAFAKLDAVAGVNQAAQCVLAVFVAPLVRRRLTRNVLSITIFLFGLMSAIRLIVGASA